MLKVCRTSGPTACYRHWLSSGQYVWKVTDRRKNPWCTKTASNLQPSDLCSNAYRILPGNQDIFYLLFFMYIFISKGTLESDLLSWSTSCGTYTRHCFIDMLPSLRNNENPRHKWWGTWPTITPLWTTLTA